MSFDISFKKMLTHFFHLFSLMKIWYFRCIYLFITKGLQFLFLLFFFCCFFMKRNIWLRAHFIHNQLLGWPSIPFPILVTCFHCIFFFHNCQQSSCYYVVLARRTPALRCCGALAISAVPVVQCQTTKLTARNITHQSALPSNTGYRHDTLQLETLPSVDISLICNGEPSLYLTVSTVLLPLVFIGGTCQH